MDHYPLSVHRTVLRVDSGSAADALEEVVSEHPLLVDVAEGPSFSLSCSPEHLRELVVGTLFSRGLLTAAEEVVSLTFSEDLARAAVSLSRRKVPPSAPCPDRVQVSASAIRTLMAHNLSASALFQRTGGVHCVTLWSPGHPPLSMEDLARHNAVDKAIGHALLHRLPLACSVLAVSGRLSADMMEKSVRAGIPIVLSKGAPTDRAIRLAETAGITLAGFIRGERMNLYTRPERIDLSR